MNETITSLEQLIKLVKMLCTRKPTAKDNWKHGPVYVFSGDHYLDLAQGQRDFLLTRSKSGWTPRSAEVIATLAQAGLTWSMEGSEISVIAYKSQKVACFLAVA